MSPFFPCQLILTPAATVADVQSDHPAVTSCSSLPTSSQVQTGHMTAVLSVHWLFPGLFVCVCSGAEFGSARSFAWSSDYSPQCHLKAIHPVPISPVSSCLFVQDVSLCTKGQPAGRCLSRNRPSCRPPDYNTR